MCDWKGEAIEGRLRASLLEPGGVLLGKCDDDQFIRREGAKRVLDRLDRVGITDPRLNVVGRCRLRKLVGPPGCLSSRVVLGVCQPVQPRDVGGWRDDEHLCILARVRADRRAQSGRRDGGGGDDEQPTRHGLSLSGSPTAFSIAAEVSLFTLARRMGTSVEQIDKTYGHLLPDAAEHERGLLDAFDTRDGHMLTADEN
jgi:hypothetical protein